MDHHNDEQDGQQRHENLGNLANALVYAHGHDDNRQYPYQRQSDSNLRNNLRGHRLGGVGLQEVLHKIVFRHIAPRLIEGLDRVQPGPANNRGVVNSNEKRDPYLDPAHRLGP